MSLVLWLMRPLCHLYPSKCNYVSALKDKLSISRAWLQIREKVWLAEEEELEQEKQREWNKEGKQSLSATIQSLLGQIKSPVWPSWVQPQINNYNKEKWGKVPDFQQ